MQKGKAYLKDIVDSMRLAVAYVGTLTVEEFERSTEKVDSVARRLEIIGEATKRLSMPLRDRHAEIPWKKMAGIRDKLIHGYDEIEADQVYAAVTEVILESLPDPD